jgi:hypothetical protein
MAPATEIRKGATTSRTGRCRAAADGVEVLELRHCAAEPDRARRGVDKIERNKPAEAMPADHQMGRPHQRRVNHHVAHLGASPSVQLVSARSWTGVVPAMAVLLIPRTLAPSESVLSLDDQDIDPRCPGLWHPGL